jgi:long-chain fatty acid transport protein
MLLLRSYAPLVLLFASVSAFATDGYFSHGFGVKSEGIGGVGIALPQDGLAAATNPAGTAFVQDRLDLGINYFVPKRNAEITGNNLGPGGTDNGNYNGDGNASSLIPEFGYIYNINPSVTTGLAVYGNGGMNTSYSNNPFAKFGNTGAGGINLAQLFVTPSVAYKLNENNALGLGVNFAYQQFSAQGLGAFAQTGANQSSISPSNVTDNGTDTSTGWGGRLGWTGKITPDLTLGATWASKISASKFSKYSGLFVNGGSFDIPENYGVGLAYKIIPTWTVALDVSRILYSGVNAVANPLSNLTVQGNPLGSANGAGFGWRDITVTKIGVSYDYAADVTLRAGYNHSDQAIPNDQTFFNILAPATVQDHLTLGGTWKATSGNELSVAYTYGFKQTVNGSNSIPSSFGGGNANISLEENILSVAYAWKL